MNGMIHVENLTKYYDSFCAVDQISMDINKGEVLGLLGPNGAGKTTTLKMLTGYFKPTSGLIRVKDYSIEDHPGDQADDRLSAGVLTVLQKHAGV